MLGPIQPTDSRPAGTDVGACGAHRWLVAIRWAAAIVFVVFGLGKFVNHASELASFRHYGLPIPGAFAYAIGVLEVAGGLLLANRVLVRVAASALGVDMLGAIIVSGIGQGEVISLTLAPTLLAGMIIVLRAGAADTALGGRASASNGRGPSDERPAA